MSSLLSKSVASDPSAVNETAFLCHLAAQYGLPIEAFSLRLSQEEEMDQEDAALGALVAAQDDEDDGRG